MPAENAYIDLLIRENIERPFFPKEPSALDIARAMIRVMGVPETLNRRMTNETCYDADMEVRA